MSVRDSFGLGTVVGDEARLERFYRFMRPAGLIVGGSIKPKWLRDGESFCYAEGAPTDTMIFRIDGRTGTVSPLFDVVRARQALAALLGHDLPYRGLPFDSFTELAAHHYQFAFQDAQYVLSSEDYSIAGCDAESKARPAAQSYRRPALLAEPIMVAEVPSPDGQWWAGVQGGNIVLRSSVDGRVVPLTSDGDEDFGWQIEFPRNKYRPGGRVDRHLVDPWSPDSGRLFASKVDRRAVPQMPFVRYLKREDELCTFRIQRAGGQLDISHPYAIDLFAKRPQPFALGDTENQYFTLIRWLSDGSEVLFSRHSRDLKTVDVLAGNPNDGSVRTVLSETAGTFLATQLDVNASSDNHVTVLPDDRALIWRSSRSGWNHFYLYGVDGTFIRPLTQGEFPVMDVVAVDGETDWVYFTAHHDQKRPYDIHLCRVKLTAGAIERLTPLDGENLVHLSPSQKFFVAINSRLDRPFQSDLHSCDGKHLATIQRADTTRLQALGYVASEEFSVIAADGETELWGVMHKPADFDATKKYPLIDRLYAGPSTTAASHHFGFGEDYLAYLDRALAQLGYIVISVDARGTPERSKAFQDVVYRNWARHEIPDHAAAIRELARRYAFIDIHRVGVWGHSWGGYFTLLAMAQAPELFRAGVTHAFAGDVYDGIIYEPYLDLPSRSKEAYDFASIHRWVHRIEGKLLMVVGTADRHRYSNALRTSHSLIQAGVDHEFVPLPDAEHVFQGKDEEYFIHKLVKHFETYLKRVGAQSS